MRLRKWIRGCVALIIIASGMAAMIAIRMNERGEECYAPAVATLEGLDATCGELNSKQATLIRAEKSIVSR